MSPAAADPPASYRAIENLIAAYAGLVDDGDCAGLGALFADATFTGGGGAVTGQAAVEKMFRDMVIVYDDGTPRSKHVTTNIAIEVERAPAPQSRAPTSPCCRRCPSCRCNLSQPAATATASSGPRGTGASLSGRSASTLTA